MTGVENNEMVRFPRSPSSATLEEETNDSLDTLNLNHFRAEPRQADSQLIYKH